MGELIPIMNETSSASQYARMIPGLPAMPAARVTPIRVATPQAPAAGGTKVKKTSSRLAELLLPHPIADAWTLYQSVGSDLLVISLACVVQTRVLPSFSFPEFALPLFAVLVTLFAFSEGVYRVTADPFPAGIVPRLSRSVAFAALLVFLAQRGPVRWMAIPCMTVSALAGLLGYRQLRQFAWVRRRRDTELRRVLLVGAGATGRSIARTLRDDPFQRTTVCGFVDDDAPLSAEVLGRIADLEWLARGEFADEIIVAIPDQPENAREAADVAFRNHLDIRAVPNLPAGPWPDAVIDYIGDVPVVTLHRESMPAPALFFKRMVDVAGAGICLLCAAPIMAVVALMIKIESKGPAVYAAERTGAKGRRFRCFKFRSMVTDADRLKDALRSQNLRTGPTFKIVGDPRITRVGAFIRRYSLDELPQLWNVLIGDMSLVGPRPHPIDDVNRYQLHHYRRLDVKPGITGLWQITARHSPSFDLNMHLDLTYIENWNLRLDLEILLGTIRVLFAPEGA